MFFFGCGMDMFSVFACVSLKREVFCDATFWTMRLVDGMVF